MKNKCDGNRENLCDKMIPGQNHNYLFLLFCLENEKNNLEKENRLCEWGSHLALSAFHLVPRSECSYSTVTMRKVRKCDFQCGVRVCGLWNSFITYDRDRWGPRDARLGTHVRLTVRGFIEALVWHTPNLECPESKLNGLIGLLPGWLRHESNLAVNVCGSVMDHGCDYFPNLHINSTN